MSRSVNRVILVGNAGSDPDIQRTASGTTVAHLSLATNRRTRVNGETQERTDWHRLTFWAAAAETIERYVRRGNRLYVEGRIEYGSYDRDGQSVLRQTSSCRSSSSSTDQGKTATESVTRTNPSTSRSPRSSEAAVARLGHEDQVLRVRHRGASIAWTHVRPGAVRPAG